jgi:hypothetical protein
MATKSKSKQASTRKQPTRAELRQRLAQDLASILANPECPTMLYNEIGGAITEMSSDLTDTFWHSPEMIERSLIAHTSKEEKRQKGGAR